MDDEDLRRLEAVGSTVSFPAGKVLIEHGQPGTGLYVVVDGAVVVEAPERESEREFGPGSVVGERALLAAHGTRTARVRAVTDCVLLAIDRAEVDRLCAEDAGFAQRLSASS